MILIPHSGTKQYRLYCLSVVMAKISEMPDKMSLEKV